VLESDAVLPARALAGDPPARRILVDRIHRPLAGAGHAPLLQTATAYLESGGSLEATARVLFVHPNTVRYRLGRISDVTGYDLTTPREAWAVRIALALGRLAATPTGPATAASSAGGAGASGDGGPGMPSRTPRLRPRTTDRSPLEETSKLSPTTS
jgi:hypothetical protein